MKRLFLITLLLLLLCSPYAKAQDATTPHLGDSAFSALITCGPGEDFYTTFGHSAIRICDTTQGIDVVYNYGMFSFNIDHFYWNFAKGNLNYWVCRDSYSSFIIQYAFEGRAVWSQQLNLSNQELNNLFVALEWNILPENKYYRYDFFMDNCATRARYMIVHSLNHRNAYTETRTPNDPSFRTELSRCTETNLLWWRFAIDMLLGVRCDKQASNAEQMFSPLNMMQQFDTLKFSDTQLPVAQPIVTILHENRPAMTPSISPTLVFWVLFVIVLSLTVIAWAKGWKLRWLDILLFGVTGLLSLLLIFLWVGTVHYCTKINLSLLWCSPLFLYFTFRLRKSNSIVLYIQMALLLILLIGFWWLPQTFNPAIFPIALTLLIRLIDKFRIIK